MDLADWATEGIEYKVYLFKWTDVDKVWVDGSQPNNWPVLARACDHKINFLIRTSGSSTVPFGATKCKELVSVLVSNTTHCTQTTNRMHGRPIGLVCWIGPRERATPSHPTHHLLQTSGFLRPRRGRGLTTRKARKARRPRPPRLSARTSRVHQAVVDLQNVVPDPLQVSTQSSKSSPAPVRSSPRRRISPRAHQRPSPERQVSLPLPLEVLPQPRRGPPEVKAKLRAPPQVQHKASI
jgi:hypothetical protein